MNEHSKDFGGTKNIGDGFKGEKNGGVNKVEIIAPQEEGQYDFGNFTTLQAVLAELERIQMVAPHSMRKRNGKEIDVDGYIRDLKELIKFVDEGSVIAQGFFNYFTSKYNLRGTIRRLAEAMIKSK